MRHVLMRLIHWAVFNVFDSLGIGVSALGEARFLKGYGCLVHPSRNRAAVYATTGFSHDDIVEICAMIHRSISSPGEKTWPPSLGLFRSVAIALSDMRRNRVQQELAEAHGTSQPTISRAISRITPLIKDAMAEFVPAADDLDRRAQYLVDGTLLPCWSWAGHPELYSGKHKTTGLNIQVAATLSGQLAWISDPIEGRRHDTFCLGESGALTGLEPGNWIGDKGYIGNDMLTPIKKPEFRPLLDWEKEFNTQVNGIRSAIERVIANIKTWRILHTDYRRPLDTFRQTISAAIGLHFWRGA
jgi:hypothetical protein